MHHTVLNCTILHHNAPYCTTLHHTAPKCTSLHHNAPQCTTLHLTEPHYTTLHPTCVQGMEFIKLRIIMGQVSKKWQKCSMVHLHVHLPSLPSFLLSLPYFAILFSPSPLPMQIQIFFADIRKSVWEKLELLCQAFMSAKGTRRWLSAACTWRCSYGKSSQWRYTEVTFCTMHHDGAPMERLVSDGTEVTFCTMHHDGAPMERLVSDGTDMILCIEPWCT